LLVPLYGGYTFVGECWPCAAEQFYGLVCLYISKFVYVFNVINVSSVLVHRCCAGEACFV